MPLRNERLCSDCDEHIRRRLFRRFRFVRYTKALEPMNTSSSDSVGAEESSRPAFLFDLDGTLIDSVYQHVVAWREALAKTGIELAVWRIHRQIGMSGGLFVNALFREIGRSVSAEETLQLQEAHIEAYRRSLPAVRPLPGARELLNYLS